MTVCPEHRREVQQYHYLQTERVFSLHLNLLSGFVVGFEVVPVVQPIAQYGLLHKIETFLLHVHLYKHNSSLPDIWIHLILLIADVILEPLPFYRQLFVKGYLQSFYRVNLFQYCAYVTNQSSVERSWDFQDLLKLSILLGFLLYSLHQF